MEQETVTFEPEWLEDKRLTWPARILLAKLYKLTDKGGKPFVSCNCNAFFKKMLGFTDAELRASWKRLTEANYLTKSTNKIEGNISTIELCWGMRKEHTVCEKNIPYAKRTQGVCEKNTRGMRKEHKGYAKFT